MKLSEAKNRFRTAKKLGYKRMPWKLWERTYHFGNNRYGKISFTDHEVLMVRDFPQLVRMGYLRLEDQAYELNRK